MTPKFKIYDVVCTKKVGLPTYGSVQGICTSLFFVNTVGIGNNKILWDDQYDGWRDKSVYAVLHQKPIRPLSLQEFKLSAQHLEDITEKQIRELYEQLPFTHVSYYPEDDLEIYSDAIVM